MATLRIGSKGKDVIRLQILLNGTLKPSPKLKADGNFGQKTKEAVVKFQKSKQLAADGIVGSKTWAAMGIKPKAATESAHNVGPAWYKIAASEIGIQEIAGPDKHNKRIVEYHSTTTLGAKTDEVPWCSSFVNWVMIQTGIKGTNNALAKSWVTWGADISTPTKGVITVIKRKSKNSDSNTGSSTGYHVGFFESSSSTVINLLGGNQSNQVKTSSFYLRSYEIIAHRVPITSSINVPNIHEIRDFSFYC